MKTLRFTKCHRMPKFNNSLVLVQRISMKIQSGNYHSFGILILVLTNYDEQETSPLKFLLRLDDKRLF